MNKDQLINKLINLNLEHCQESMEYNDQFIYDLLRYGFKGFDHMSINELKDQILNLEG